MKIHNLHLGASCRDFVSSGLQWALPDVVAADTNLFALAFTVMKVLPAFSIIRNAVDMGQIEAGGTVAETSSGSFAYGLAQVCNLYRLNLRIVTDRGVDGEFERGLRSLGAGIDFIDAPSNAVDLQSLRLARLKEILAETNGYWPNQYGNVANSRGYAAAAEIVARSLGVITDLVAPVGSGGSAIGMARFLRLVNPDMRLIGVDTFGSVLFGLPVAKRDLRGLGNSLVPGNLDHSAFDEVHWIDAPTACAGVSKIAAKGLGEFGPTSGAAYVVARSIAQMDPLRRVLMVFPDRGTRYRGLLSAHQARVPQCVVPPEPKLVLHLDDVVPPWSCMAWNRRTLHQVCGEEEAA